MPVHFGHVWSFYLKATFSLSGSDTKKELERGAQLSAARPILL